MKVLKTVGIFFGTFLIYHLVGCTIFPADENNVLQAPTWYPIVGLSISACAAFFAGKADALKLPWQKAKKKPNKRSFAKAASTEPSLQDAPFPPTGNPQLDAAMAVVDAMDGHDFELFCAELLERCGYQNIHVTKGSGDQGVDIIAIKHGVRYAFQCKRYSSKLGNKPVQEVHTGKQFYSCQVGVVISNSYFTRGAEDAARRVGVQLWDRDSLIRKMGW